MEIITTIAVVILAPAMAAMAFAPMFVKKNAEIQK